MLMGSRMGIRCGVTLSIGGAMFSCFSVLFAGRQRNGWGASVADYCARESGSIYCRPGWLIKDFLFSLKSYFISDSPASTTFELLRLKYQREDFVTTARPLLVEHKSVRNLGDEKKDLRLFICALNFHLRPVFYCGHVFFILQFRSGRNIYLLERAETPGRSLPSRSSKLAPPPVETWLSLSSTP